MAANYIPLRVLADCNQDSAKRKEKRNFVSVGVGTLVFIPGALGLQADGPTVVAVPGGPALVLGNFDPTCLGHATAEFFTSGTPSSYRLVDLPERFEHGRMPIISVDSKKRELVGNFKNSGARWDRQGWAVNDHDFLSDAIGVAIPL